MNRKLTWLAVLAPVLVIVLLFAAYQVFRFPAAFRRLSNRALSERLGADLFEISPGEPYSNLYLESNMEIRMGERPELSETVENIEEYDIVFVGYPVWFHATPAPVNSFLESHDLTGKLVIPFCTSGGSGIDETMPTFLDSCDGMAVYGGRRIRGTGQIEEWLSGLGLNGTEKEVPDSAREAVPAEMESASKVQETALREIPDDYTQTALREIPASYLEAAQHQGTVVRLDYQTNTYDGQNESLSKYAFIYLPYGYEESDTRTRYNVFYLMHGGGGTAERYLGGENGDEPLKRILDHMIENGDIEPMIVVTPTFYHDNSSGPEAELTANFHHELVRDLMPAVESTYHTYAESTDREGLAASREHRIFGGFSMGSVTTWYTFIEGLDYFKYYLPISGDCWLFGRMGGSDEGYVKTVAYLNQVVQDSGRSPDDYYIYAATGTEDIAYEALSEQVEAMRAYPETFIYNQDFTKGNFYYGVVEGGVHNNTYMNQYIYNALPAFGL